MDSDLLGFRDWYATRSMRELLGLNGRRTRADRDKQAAQKRANARNQREKMKRHHRTSRKGRGKGKAK